MAGYMEFLRGSKQQELDPVEAQLKKELTGEVQTVSPYVAGTTQTVMTPQQKAEFGAAEAAGLGTSAASGAMMGGPVGAGIMVGGQLASQYLAQKAADERAKRERAAQIEQNYGQDQQRALGQIQQAMMGAFR